MPYCQNVRHINSKMQMQEREQCTLRMLRATAAMTEMMAHDDMYAF